MMNTHSHPVRLTFQSSSIRNKNQARNFLISTFLFVAVLPYLQQEQLCFFFAFFLAMLSINYFVFPYYSLQITLSSLPGADPESRTRNLLFTKQLLCH